MPVSLTDDTIRLDGYIGQEEGEISAVAVAFALNGRRDVTVCVNSPGGVASEGAAIHSILSRHLGKVTILVEGVAASAASLMAMASDEIVMTPASTMMIHDPYTIALANADGMRKCAQDLDVQADVYAEIYAQRANMPKDDARALMRQEIWLSPEDAVAMGFADRTTDKGGALPYACDYSLFRNAPAPLMEMARARGWVDSETKEPPMSKPTAPAATQETPAATTAPAPVEMAVAPAAGPASPAAAPQVASSGADAEMSALRAREAIRAAVMSLPQIGELTAPEVEQIVARASDPAGAKMAAADMIVDKRAAEVEVGTEVRTPGVAATITRDEQETRMEALIGGLRSQYFGARLEGPAAEYRGMTLRRLAMMLAGQQRFNVADHEHIRAGMFETRGALMAGAGHSTSDFTFVTGELMNRELRARYGSFVDPWMEISRARTANDFRTIYSAQFGGDMSLKRVGENGEYESTVLTDAGDSFRVQRYGRSVLLTFEAVVNDDLGAFGRLPMDFARAARQRECALAWGVINANAAMADGVALFHANHSNLAGSGGALSATTVLAGRKAIFEQRPLGATATGDEFIGGNPDLLLVPTALELKAMQFLAKTVPTKDEDTNPYKTSLRPLQSPYLGASTAGGSDTAWYLADSSLPVLEHAHLTGYEAPQVEAEEKRNPKGIELLAETIFGVTAVEYRGIYKNAGA